MVTMTYITMKQIKENGKIYLEDELNIIYLTPSDPMTYHMNKWQYKTLPSINQWYSDMGKQRILHKNNILLIYLLHFQKTNYCILHG